MKQKILYLLCGIPGAGKSTWIKNQISNYGGVWCSRDIVRFSLIKEDEKYFAKEDLVFSTWINEIQSAINNKEGPDNIYVDATHLTPKARDKVLNKLNLQSVELRAVNFILPLETCLKRNGERSGRQLVPDSVIHNMYASFRPATVHEGFITIINITE